MKRERTSTFHTRLIISYAALITLVIVLSIGVADALFTRVFESFLAGRFGVPFAPGIMAAEPGAYLMTATYLRFREIMRLSVWTGGCAVMLVALGLAGWFARGFSRPVGRFAGFADRIGRGDYSVHIADKQGLREFEELADSLNRMARQLKCRNEVEQELFANLSHELRTPVTVVKGYTEAFEAGLIATPEELQAAGDAIAQETANLEDMIDELRELSRIDANAVLPEASDFELDDALSEMCRGFARAAQAKGVALSCQLEAGTRVRLDRQLLERVVTNVVHNSLTATPPGHSISITSAVDAGGKVTITVHDTGRGIPEADLAHVFDRFFRGDRSRNRSSGGLGLGLPIARDLVEVEGGHLDIMSILGAGTAVTITYPASVVVREASLVAS